MKGGKCRNFALLAAILLALPGAVPPPGPLYTGQAIVTGTDERDRPRGLAQCLDQVLIKVSGDPNITGKPGVQVFRQRAETILATIGYHDRMSNLPHHDEQGSRDRPFTLTAQFDPEKIRAALASLGETPWQGQRPHVLLLVSVHGFAGNFTITTTEPAAELMREAIDDAADQYALQAQVPAQAPNGTPAAPPGTMLVQGTLDWSDSALGWVARWHTDWNGHSTNWGERGVSFDDAFRGAMAGALGTASGHGPPHD